MVFLIFKMPFIPRYLKKYHQIPQAVIGFRWTNEDKKNALKLDFKAFSELYETWLDCSMVPRAGIEPARGLRPKGF
jgi:hypothetical protein